MKSLNFIIKIRDDDVALGQGTKEGKKKEIDN